MSDSAIVGIFPGLYLASIIYSKDVLWRIKWISMTLVLFYLSFGPLVFAV